MSSKSLRELLMSLCKNPIGIAYNIIVNSFKSDYALVKLLTLGEPGVGKTSLIAKCYDDSLQAHPVPMN